jgi:pimeloyl-ACP methyl ester carboxylesterase
MERAKIGPVEIEYDVTGTGEPVLLIHGATIAETFVPMVPHLSGYRVIRMHRRGAAGSSHPGGPTKLVAQSEDALGLLRHLGIPAAHVVGHSLGGLIALRMAVDAPEVVRTLSLLEAPVLTTPEGEQHMRQVAGPAGELFKKGDAEGALDSFLRAVGGADYRKGLDLLPGAWEQGVRNVPVFFGSELASGLEGFFREEEASRLKMPVLLVVGTTSEALFQDSHRTMVRWLPNAETLDIPGATHFLQVEKPREVGGGVRAFLQKHPIR